MRDATGGPGAGSAVRPYGDRALLVDTPDPLALAAALVGLPGLVDVVPGAASVLVLAGSPAGAQALRGAVATAAARAAEEAASPSHPSGEDLPPVDLPVVYDGPDLPEVAALTGLDAGEVRRRHAAGTYTVALVGFAPGFGYLRGLDPALAVPRRDEPRPAVPAGSVAVGGPWTGVYPRATPGGWRLLGRTAAPLWDAERDPPALLRPGVRVRFVDVGP